MGRQKRGYADVLSEQLSQSERMWREFTGGERLSGSRQLVRREKQGYFSENPTQDQLASSPGCMHGLSRQSGAPPKRHVPLSGDIYDGHIIYDPLRGLKTTSALPF